MFLGETVIRGTFFKPMFLAETVICGTLVLRAGEILNQKVLICIRIRPEPTPISFRVGLKGLPVALAREANI
jgi:hypothetical protein